MEFYTFAKKNYNKRHQRINTFEPIERLERRNQLPFDYEQEQYEDVYENQPFYYEEEPKPFYYEKEPKDFYYEQWPKNFYKKRPFTCEHEQYEEEYMNQPFYYEHEPTIFAKRQPFEMEQEQRVPRKWYNVMYIKENRRPEEITIVVDPIYHTITVNGKRVIPLPKNVNVQELRVKCTPRGELLFKAPCYSRFVDTTEFQRSEKFTIPVIFSQKARAQKYQQRQQRQQKYFQRFFVPQYFQRYFQQPQYFHVLKDRTDVPKFVETRCERDETTGKFMIVFEVNTVGFRREEIQVRFVEEQHLLLVKAMHQERYQETTELKGIAPKTLKREFILPEWLEGSEMRYRLLKNGLLRIEVPCLRKHCPMTTERTPMKQQQLFQNYNFYKTY